LDSSRTPEAMKKRKKAYEFMVSFRETFSRPVRRIVSDISCTLGRTSTDTIAALPRVV
jgi:hypothetical protein